MDLNVYGLLLFVLMTVSVISQLFDGLLKLIAMLNEVAASGGYRVGAGVAA